MLLQQQSNIFVLATEGGNITLTARNLDLVGSNLLAGVTNSGGNPTNRAGDIRLRATGTITATQDSVIGNAVFGTGIGGNIEIQAGSLSLLDGTFVGNPLIGEGIAGNVVIDVRDRITIRGLSPDNRRASGILSSISLSGRGRGGDVQIAADVVSIDQGAGILGVHSGQGNSGNITVNARSAILVDGGAVVSDRVLPSTISSNISGSGNSGMIQLTTPLLQVTNGANITAQVLGQGNSGGIVVNARDAIALDGTDPFQGNAVIGGIFTSLLGGNGNGGNIQLSTGSLSITNGAQINSYTNGIGNAGNISIQARSGIVVDGEGLVSSVRADGLQVPISSGIDSSVLADGSGQGGTIQIQAESLRVTNGAGVTSNTLGQGNAGNIIIKTHKGVEVGGSDRSGEFRSIIASKVFFDESTPSFAQGTGQGGTIQIQADTISLFNKGGIEADSNSPQGSAGNINLTANIISLDTNAVIAASTNVNTGGNISLNARDYILLRRNSLISASGGLNAFDQQGTGDGGNITINTGFLIAAPNENSDIRASAFSGRGGQVTVNAQGIFWFVPRSREELQRLLGTNDPTQLDSRRLITNDITAISQGNPDLNGLVVFNTPDINLSRGLANLPVTLTDPTQQIDQRCTARQTRQANSFIVTGRGGIASSPFDALQDESVLAEWVEVQRAGRQRAKGGREVGGDLPSRSSPSSLSPSPSQSLLEANSWVRSPDGTIYLVASIPIMLGRAGWQLMPDCSLLHEP